MRLTSAQIKGVIDDHRLWREGKGGQRAKLCRVDLRDADLRGAYLRDANLCGANLHNADLREANLRRAKLCGVNLWHANLLDANLYGANLRGADLRDAVLRRAVLLDASLEDARGILLLPVDDPRPYRWVAVAHHDGWRIATGCRWFTISEARTHCHSPDYAGPQSVKDTVGPALDWLEAQPLPQMETET